MLQPRLSKRDHDSWIREKRLEAYAELCGEFLALGKGNPQDWDITEARARAATAILVASDSRLHQDVEDLLHDIHIFNDMLVEAAHAEDEFDGNKIRATAKQYGIKVNDTATSVIDRLRKEITSA